MTDYDPTSEYTLMSGAGLSFSQILTSLTTEPARRFGASNTGRLSAGLKADVVIVAGRPDRAIEKLAAVVTVLRGGEIVYRHTEPQPGR
jgi:imidazolonepropionase-like amidohydrolase